MQVGNYRDRPKVSDSESVALVMGGTGRLGEPLCAQLRARGDKVIALGKTHGKVSVPINYAIFAQRYRGESQFGELQASVILTHEILERIKWADGDCAAVIVSSDCADRVSATGNVGYMVGKAAARYLVPWYARNGAVRINAVSPARFTGEGVVVDIQEVVNVILFLCSPLSRGINGENIVIDKGVRWKT